MRAFLFALFVGFVSIAARASDFAAVTPGKALEFPRDAGSHPEHRIEWWYVTGQLETARGPMGFQVTFFRLRNPDAEANPSRFSPKQLLFAHAALADPAKGQLMHDQRSARALEGLVEAKTGDMNVRIDDWVLERLPSPPERALRQGEGANVGSGFAKYRTHIEADGFALELTLTPTQPVLLQGDRGYSRKGVESGQASYYYSEPHLRVSGRIKAAGEAHAVTGTAWLDHEWSSALLAADAVGWDWLGANLDDGAALMAFRMRAQDGTTLWANATYRAAGGAAVTFGPEAVRFAPRRTWKSPRTGAVYPVAMDIEAGGRTYRIEPLMDDQELDARSSTGTIYWEGAVRVDGAPHSRGRGYLELTGYAGRLRF